MLDRPEAPRLLRSMAETLTDDVLPTTSGPARHAVRVVANLCRILEREVQHGPANADATRKALSELLGLDGELSDLVGELDRALFEAPLEDPSDGEDDFDARVRKLILEDVERRLEVDRPGYAS